MSSNTPRYSRRVAIAPAALLVVLSGCGDGNESGTGGSGATTGTGGTSPFPEFGSSDRTDIRYADNLLQKVKD